jgi:hypothetical protein
MNIFAKSLLLCLVLISAASVTFFVTSAQDDGQPPKSAEALPTLEVTPAPTEASIDPYWGSYLLLRPDVDPMLGVELFTSDQGPKYFSGATQAGGSTFIQLGNGCAEGYTTATSALGMVWVSESGPINIGFVPDDPNVEVALVLWEVGPSRWWCNFEYSLDNELAFDNVGQGAYFVWVLTHDTTTIPGTIYVEGNGQPAVAQEF